MVEAGAVRFRWLIALACAGLVAVVLLPLTAKPISWDELVYMNLAFLPDAKGWRLNRYAHIYALLPFMRITGDPYVGARLFWSCAVGLTTGILVRAALAETAARRWTVVGLTLLFFAAQQIVFAYPGIAYAEYTAMVATTAAFCFAWTRLAGSEGIRLRDAALLGFLLFVAIKASEFALPSLLLFGLLFLTPAGRLRFERRNLRLAACWIGGMGLGQLLLMTLDHTFVRDALFSLRPASWRDLLAYNVPDHPQIAAEYERLGWLMRPDLVLALLPYTIAGVLFLRTTRDARLTWLYALPLASFALLIGVDLLGRLDFAPRYVVPVLPVTAFFAAAALSRWLATKPAHWIARLATAAVVLPSLVSASMVLTALARRDVQRIGDARFAGFYEVARAVQIERDDVVFVSDRLYDGAIRPGVLPWLTRLNFNVPLWRRQMPSSFGAEVDYAVVSAEEQRGWSTTRGAAPIDTIVSADGRVALLCLRHTCPRRAP